MVKKIVVIFVFMFVGGQVWAHSGGTDAKGCHHDRKNGGYHCHNKK